MIWVRCDVKGPNSHDLDTSHAETQKNKIRCRIGVCDGKNARKGVSVYSKKMTIEFSS